MAKPRRHFAVCVRNEGYEVSLELRELYEVVPDQAAGRHGQIRVIDESGEDYLFPAFLVRSPRIADTHQAGRTGSRLTFKWSRRSEQLARIASLRRVEMRYAIAEMMRHNIRVRRPMSGRTFP